MSSSRGKRIDLIAIGASAGGVSAIRKLLTYLHPDFQIPVLIVQHMPPTARLDVGLIYGSGTGARVVEVEDKMRLDPGIVYMACPGYHILVERDRTVALSVDDPVMYSRPSIDVFFMSVARSLKSRAIGILLTGANGDGAEGLQLIHEVGGITIVQDPEEAESPFMPRAALNRFEPSFVLELGSIADLLNSFVSSQTELSL